MEAHSRESSGLNLNPLAPAGSRTFANSVKTQNVIDNSSMCASFFYPFLFWFRAFSRTVEKGSNVQPWSHQNTLKWIPRVPKRSPRINKLTPRAPLRTKNMQNCPRMVAKWSRKCYNGVPRPPKCKKNTKKVSRVEARKWAAKS